MKFLSNRSITMSLVLLFSGGLGVWVAAQDRPRVVPIPTRPANENIRTAMARKLSLTQNVMRGLVTNDLELVATTAAELKKVSLEAPKSLEGTEIDNQLYTHFQLEFLRLTTQLETLAQAENPEGAAFAYQNLTANCLACHSYLNDLQ